MPVNTVVVVVVVVVVVTVCCCVMSPRDLSTDILVRLYFLFQMARSDGYIDLH